MPIRMKIRDEDLYKMVEKCRRIGGMPVVITRYAGKPLRYKGARAVVFACYGLGDPKPVVLTGISEGTWEEFDAKRFAY